MSESEVWSKIKLIKRVTKQQHIGRVLIFIPKAFLGGSLIHCKNSKNIDYLLERNEDFVKKY